MQQTLNPSYQFGLQRLARLWLSIRHRGPSTQLLRAEAQGEAAGQEEPSRPLHTGRIHTRAVAKLAHAVQDAETIWQNRQLLYACVKEALTENSDPDAHEDWEPVLDDMLIDHLLHLSQNLEKAQEVQQRFLPQELPTVPTVELFATLRPATELSGDFYDFIATDSDDFFFSIGDISSKGMSAALLMPVICKVLRTAINYVAEPTPKALLAFVHDDMYAQFNGASMFASIFAGHYSPATRQLTYANAGHSPVIYKPVAGASRYLKADGTPVGLLQKGHWQNHTLTLAPGDLLLVGTDGLVDVCASSGNRFGYEQLLQTVETVAAESAATIADRLFAALQDFAPNQLHEDDQALLIFKGR